VPRAMTRADRLVLGIEIAVGILPITIVGGITSVMGMYFGGVSVAISVAERSLSAATLWLGILGLAAGGLAGIVGLWAVVLVTISPGRTDQALAKAAIFGSVTGVVTAAIAMLQAFRGDGRPSAEVVALLVAPVLVVAHRLPAILRRAAEDG